jgi:hypothetical protein
LVLALGTLATPAFGQLSVGIKGGVPLTDTFETAREGPLAFFSKTHRSTIGPTVEFHLPLGFSIEFDALYRRINYGSDSASGNLFVATRTKGNAWDFPILLKMRASSGVLRPFVDGGPAFRHVSSLEQETTVTNISGQTVTRTERPLELEERSTPGVAAGAGVEIKLGPIEISPEVRYTRWFRDTFRSGNGLLESNRNQADFLLGITF